MGLVLAGMVQAAEVTFRVHCPAVSAKRDVYLTGNLPQLGNWNPAGVKLDRVSDTFFVGTILLAEGELLEYKFTRGDWGSVERDRKGNDIANRRLRVREKTTIDVRVESWTNRRERRESSRTGDIRVHNEFYSRFLDNERTLLVYLPPGYETGPERRYPVLYMHDGQNVFDAATSFIGVEWGADETAERLIEEERIPPLIIVAVYNNADRINELSPTFESTRKGGGKGDLYAKFLVQEVKPFIDRTYRTVPDRDHTGVAGSSLGGLISLYIGLEYPGVFSRVGVISPALWWGDRYILKEVEKRGRMLEGSRLWIDMGTEEGDIPGFNEAIQNTRDLVRTLDRFGFVPGRDYYYQEVYAAKHNEKYWAERFDKVLLYLYGDWK